jgi:hypothetical protein
MDGLTWITTNADKTSIVGYLALTLFIVGFGLWRKWWVIGWQYQDQVKRADNAEARVEEFRKAADERAERMERKLEILQEAERQAHASRSTSRRSGSSS